MKKPALLTAVAMAAYIVMTASTESCTGRTGGDDRPVPRPEAFPRVEHYAPAYHPLDSVGLRFEVNDSTVTVPSDKTPPPGDSWVTLAYPRYGGARLFVTFTATTAATVDGVIENRTERMALNAGQGNSELLELQSDGGFNARLLTTRAGTVTPLQFIATDPAGRMVVSGALFIDGATSSTSPDSLTPVIDAVRDDLIHALRHLRL